MFIVDGLRALQRSYAKLGNSGSDLPLLAELNRIAWDHLWDNRAQLPDNAAGTELRATLNRIFKEADHPELVGFERLRAVVKAREHKLFAACEVAANAKAAALVRASALSSALACELLADGLGTSALVAVAAKSVKIGKKEANLKAREILRDKPNISERKLANTIGCSPALVGNLPVWKARQETLRAERKPRGGIKTIRLTEKLEAMLADVKCTPKDFEACSPEAQAETIAAIPDEQAAIERDHSPCIRKKNK